MKKKLLNYFTIAVIFSLSFKTVAQCNLSSVGASNFVQNSLYSSMALSKGFVITPYTFAFNSNLSVFELHAFSTNWSIVASFSGSTTINPAIAISKNDDISVFIRDDNDGGKGKVYTLSGSSFSAVGGVVSTGVVTNLSITYDALGNQFIAYTDVANGGKSTVKQWDGSSWINVGTGAVSVAGGSYNSLAIDNTGNTVLAFMDANAANKTSIYTCIPGGSTWTNIGSFGTTNTSNAKLKINSAGDYYLGYTDNAQNAFVQKYNGSSWTSVGTSLTSVYFSANAFDIDIDADGTPYLLAISTFTPEIHLFKFDGSAWNIITNANNYSSANYNISLAIDRKGKPFVFNVETQTINSLNVRSVTNTNNITSEALSKSVCEGATGSFTVGYAGSPSFTWKKLISGDNFATIPFQNTNTLTYTATPGDKYYKLILNSATCYNIISDLITLSVVNPVASFTTISPTCYNRADGFINTSVANGSGNYTFSWLPGGENEANISNLSAGTYSLTFTDQGAGCAVTTTVNVTPPAPIIINTAGNTSICPGNTTTLTVSANGGLMPYTYSWTPGPGLTVISPTVINANPATSQVYSVEVMDNYNCAATTTVSVNIKALPSLIISTTATTICEGNSINMNGGGAATYTWLPGNISSQTITVTPSLGSTVYTLTGTGSNGCDGSVTQTILVNSNPVLSVSNNKNICKGSTANLNVNGATTYTWSTGATTNSISVTPTVNTTYSVIGQSGIGCSSTTTVNVSLISSKNINGAITNTTGLTSGSVILYKYVPYLRLWDSVTTTTFNPGFTFNNIDSANYVIKAIPTATNFQVTYSDSSTSWQDAKIISHGCQNQTNQNIKLKEFTNFVLGPGELSGKVIKTASFGHRLNSEFKPTAAGEPIGGITVKGGRNPGGQMLVQTTTDALGQYVLPGLPISTGNESYFILIDIPGLDTNGTYHISLTNSQNIINNLNFTVDSVYINPFGTITGIANNEMSTQTNAILFPNPANGIVSLKYELTNSSNVEIDLYDVVGKKVKTLLPKINQEKNSYLQTFDLTSLISGIYFIKLHINEFENNTKLIISN